MLKRANLALCIAALSLGSNASAGEYQIELGASLIDGEIESDLLEEDVRGRTLGAATYFGGVDDSNGPLAEAPFIERSSLLALNFLSLDTDETEVDGEEFGIALRLVNADTGWTFGFGFDSGTVEQIDTEAVTLSVGKYVAETTELGFSVIFGDEEVNGDKEDSESWVLSVDHLFNGALPVALGAEIGSVALDGENDQLLAIGATVYPMKSLGIGASYEVVDNDEETNTTVAFVEWFFQRAYAVNLGYQTIDFGETAAGDTDSEYISLGLRGRF